MDYIQNHQSEKISKMLDKGLDPNYHDSETGGTPPFHLQTHTRTQTEYRVLFYSLQQVFNDNSATQWQY